MLIRRLLPSDAGQYQTLRLQALRESPTSFSSSYEEEVDTPTASVAVFLAASDRGVFGAFADVHLVGVLTIGRESLRKARHKAFIGAMYVAPPQRGAGVAKQLLKAALAHAESMGGVRQVTLCVTSGNAAAMALYESLGFVTFGREPNALLIEGVFYEDVHMVRYLGV